MKNKDKTYIQYITKDSKAFLIDVDSVEIGKEIYDILLNVHSDSVKCLFLVDKGAILDKYFDFEYNIPQKRNRGPLSAPRTYVLKKQKRKAPVRLTKSQVMEMVRYRLTHTATETMKKFNVSYVTQSRRFNEHRHKLFDEIENGK